MKATSTTYMLLARQERSSASILAAGDLASLRTGRQAPDILQEAGMAQVEASHTGVIVESAKIKGKWRSVDVGFPQVIVISI